MKRDPLSEWFEQHGYGVRAHFLRKTGIQLGWRFVDSGCEVAWRCEGQRVWIVMFRRLDERLGRANPFAALYVLAEAARSVLPAPAWLYGNVQVLADSPLAGARLGRFYHRWAGAREPQPGWFELDANRVCSLQDMRKRQKLDRA